jgi:hypothetical protein
MNHELIHPLLWKLSAISWPVFIAIAYCNNFFVVEAASIEFQPKSLSISGICNLQYLKIPSEIPPHLFFISGLVIP